MKRSEDRRIVGRPVRIENHHHYIRYHDNRCLYALSLALETPTTRISIFQG